MKVHMKMNPLDTKIINRHRDRFGATWRQGNDKNLHILEMLLAVVVSIST